MSLKEVIICSEKCFYIIVFSVSIKDDVVKHPSKCISNIFFFVAITIPVPLKKLLRALSNASLQTKL